MFKTVTLMVKRMFENLISWRDYFKALV